MTSGAVSPAPVRRPGRTWWLAGLTAVGGLLFTAGLLVEVRCAVGRCPGPRVQGLLGLDGLGGLPRLFTTGVFVAAAVLAGLAAVRFVRRWRTWWAAVAAGGVVLAVAKVVSSHSALEQDGGRVATLVGGTVLAVVGLSGLWVAGRRWAVPGATAVTAALAVYAAVALGLDQVTARAWSPVALAVASYVEEGGEGLAAVAVLAVVSAWGLRR